MYACFSCCTFHRTHDIGKLSDTGWLDQDTVRMILIQYLLQC